MRKTIDRCGMSLIEAICTIGIIALLAGLVLSAVLKVRTESVRLQSTNNIRQIVLGVHQLADQRMGKIDQLSKSNMPLKLSPYTEQSLFRLILPYTDHTRVLPDKPSQAQAMDFFFPVVKTYVSPGDPTLDIASPLSNIRSKCSYSFNMVAVDGGLHVPISFPDGTGTTLCVAERYFYSSRDESYLDFTWIFPKFPDEKGGQRRATFADSGWKDVVPVTASGTTVASVSGRTFQVRPKLTDVDSSIPQTPFSSGLPVGFFDGSVRTLSPSIKESVFWALVTPQGSEVIGDF